MNRWYDRTLYRTIHRVADPHPLYRRTSIKRVAACCLFLFCLVISLATPAWADLIAYSGDILDTQTGSVWIPITATESMTVEQVQAATLSGGIFYGYQFATTSQIQGLLKNAFGVSSPGAPGAGLTFVGLFGYDLGFGGPGQPTRLNLAAPFDDAQSDLSQPLGPNSLMGVATVQLTTAYRSLALLAAVPFSALAIPLSRLSMRMNPRSVAAGWSRLRPSPNPAPCFSSAVAFSGLICSIQKEV